MKNMKRTIIFTAMALMISAGVMAQSQNQVRTQARNETQAQDQTQEQTQTQEQVRVQNMTNAQERPRNANRILRQERKQLKIHNEAAEAGQAVRQRARTTASGPGKGEAVSQQARIRQENRALSGAAPRNQGVSATQMQRANMNMTKRAGSGRR